MSQYLLFTLIFLKIGLSERNCIEKIVSLYSESEYNC